MSSSSDCSLQNEPQEQTQAAPEHFKSVRWPMKCFYCEATQNLKTELEKHLKPNKFRRNVHCEKSGNGSVDITEDIWNAHYAEQN